MVTPCFYSYLENTVRGKPASVPTANEMPMRNLEAPRSSKCQKRNVSRNPQSSPAKRKAAK